MGSTMIMLVLIVVAVIAFFVFRKKDNTGSNKQMKNTDGVKEKEVVTGVKRPAKDIVKKDMSEFIRFDKIANDMIYQNHGEKYTMVIQCKGINYELMSEIEQMAVEEGFITFLNTLKFPIQLYVQTRSVNLNDNITKYKQRVEMFADKAQKITQKYNELADDIDSDLDEMEMTRQEQVKYANLVEYVEDITKYVERLAANKQMLQRRFYIILSYNKSDLVTTEKFSKKEYEDLCYRELYTRAQGIVSSLLACSVTARVLNSNELAELLYISLNKDDEKTLDIRKSIESGFYRLYTTSDDVREKRQKIIDEEIMKESMKRIEESIREAIRNGVIVPQEEMADAMDKEIDKTALRTIDNSKVSQDVKDALKKDITAKRRERLKKREEERRKIAEAEQNAQEKIEEQMQNEVAQKEEIIEEKAVEVESEDSQEELFVEQMEENVINTASETEKEELITGNSNADNSDTTSDDIDLIN